MVVSDSTLRGYDKGIKWGKEKSLPFSQGYAINEVIKRYRISAIRWGYDGNRIAVETKKQKMFWKDTGTKLVFLGLINKKGSVKVKSHRRRI